MPRRDLVARARHRHGRRRPRHPGREPEVGRARPAARRPSRARAALGLEGPDLPEVPGRPPRVRRRRPRDARGRDRGDAHPAKPARRARAADRRDLRRRGDRGRRACTSSCVAPTRSPSSRGRSSRTSSTCSRAGIRRTSSPSCGRGSSGIAPAGVVRGRTGARRLAVTNAGTIPDRGLFGVFLVDGGGRVGELDEEMVYEAREGQTFVLGASTWRIEDITRDRVLVSPAPGVPGRCAVLEGRGRGAAGGARREDRAHLPRARRALPTTPRSSGSRASTGSTRSRRATSSRSCVSRRRRRASSRRTARSSSSASATRSATGASASSRRSGAACTRPGRWRFERGCVTRSPSTCSRSGRTTASRSTSRTPTRHRRVADLLLEPDEIEELLLGELAPVGALRLAVPGERRASAAHPAPPSRPAHAALAAAAEGAEPPPGRAALPAVPDRARDVP